MLTVTPMTLPTRAVLNPLSDGVDLLLAQPDALPRRRHADIRIR